ncbi:MAG: hypothetical protein ACK401_02460 [Archaeoglobaceae archaeon]
MLYDNAGLLSLCSIAYRVFGKELYKKLLVGSFRYYQHYGYDQNGGFYVSQAVNVGGKNCSFDKDKAP